MQQGDPLGSALFALGNHPCLVEIAQRHPKVLVTGYADNTFLLGPLQAVTKAIPDFQVILQKANLQLNTSESNLHVPHWATMTGWLNARTKKQGPLAFLSFLRIAKRLGSEG